MLKEWKTYRLGDLIEVNKKSISKNYEFDTIEYFDTSSVTANTFSEPTRLLLKEAPSRAKRIVEHNDVLYSTVRPNQLHYGIIKNPKPNTVVSTGFAVLKAKGINPEYLFYFLTQNEIVQYLNSIAETSTTTFPAFNPSNIEDLEADLPDLITQQRIASILSSLDDAIELNQQINKTLEEMSKAIFKEWFVDFNFPNATGKFQETEIGKIPVGWQVGKLSDGFNITMGQSPSGESYNEEKIGTPFFQGRTDFGFRYPSNRIYTTQPKRFAKKLDTLVSVRAPVGDMNIASEDCCIGRGLASVIHKNYNPSFTYYFLNSLVEKFKMFEGTGTIFGSINKADFENMACIYPTIELINDFEKVCSSLDEQILNNEKENQSLINLRDTLLPKLMKGEIEIK